MPALTTSKPKSWPTSSAWLAAEIVGAWSTSCTRTWTVRSVVAVPSLAEKVKLYVWLDSTALSTVSEVGVHSNMPDTGSKWTPLGVSASCTRLRRTASPSASTEAIAKFSVSPSCTSWSGSDERRGATLVFLTTSSMLRDTMAEPSLACATRW